MVRIRDVLDDLAVDFSLVEDRAGRYPRSLVRQRHRQYIRAHWNRLLTVFIVGLALAGLVAFLPAWTRGFIWGIWLASVIWFIAVLVMQGAGTSPTMMGASAEQWTAHEMRRLRRKGWRVTSHVRPWSYGGDVDHLAVGPGGAVVIESKWVSDPETLEQDDRVQRDRKSLAKSANRIRGILRRQLQGAPIRSALVYWGAVRTTDSFRSIPNDDPQVLIGSEFPSWLKEVVSPMPRVMSEDDVTLAWKAIHSSIDQTDRLELGPDYRSKHTGLRIALDVLVGPFAALITFWIAALLLRPLGVIDLVLMAAFGGVGVLLYSNSRESTATTRRRAGAGMVAASVFIMVVVGAVYLGSRLFHF
jgi:hypothetical protein